VTAFGLLALASRLPSTSVAQPPAGTPEVNPKILAFLKPVEIPEGDSELQKKLKERHNVAVKLLDERVNEYKKGVRDVSAVFEAARLTADAKLELAESKEARAEVLEQVLDIAKLIESHLEQQLKKGFGSKSDLERARLARLTVEVELLRAKSKDNPTSK
jgi:hypothetical protein